MVRSNWTPIPLRSGVWPLIVVFSSPPSLAVRVNDWAWTLRDDGIPVEILDPAREPTAAEVGNLDRLSGCSIGVAKVTDNGTVLVLNRDTSQWEAWGQI